MPTIRRDNRIVRSTGVHEPQRCPWLSTQRTAAGSARPSRKRADSSAARVISSSSLRSNRRSPASTRRTMRSTHCASSARVSRAGTCTMMREPLRYAEIVRRRRALRTTCTSGDASTASAVMSRTVDDRSANFLAHTPGGWQFPRSANDFPAIPSAFHICVQVASTATPRTVPTLSPSMSTGVRRQPLTAPCSCPYRLRRRSPRWAGRALARGRRVAGRISPGAS
jgi:hypothetical protein